jgi:predicted adenylyl cyclase CyaB
MKNKILNIFNSNQASIKGKSDDVIKLDDDGNMLFTEFETKYNSTCDKRMPFKNVLEDLEDTSYSFLYVESSDYYYVNGDDFIRHRHGNGNNEVTVKKKSGDKNNIIRREVNVPIDPSCDVRTMEAFVNHLGYKFNFEIYKYCDIYVFDDATLCFYTVKDQASGEYRSFIEIEVKEDMKFTEKQAWAIIHKYENILSKVGVSEKERLEMSLFEMYVRKNKFKSVG